VIARAERGRVVIDLRTVPPQQDAVVGRAIGEALEATAARGRAPAGPPTPPAPGSRGDP
jgi:hypothetical protein